MPPEFGENEVVYEPHEPCGEPLPTEEPEHWIEIELYYEETGEPVPGEEYYVKTPDGVQRRGCLDTNGFAREDWIVSPGDCEITFPRLDL